MVISPGWNYKDGIDRCFMFASHCLFTAAVRSVPQLIVVLHNNNHVFLIGGLVAVLRYPFSSARLPFPPHQPHLYSSVATLLHVTARRPALESIHDGTVVAALVRKHTLPRCVFNHNLLSSCGRPDFSARRKGMPTRLVSLVL